MNLSLKNIFTLLIVFNLSGCGKQKDVDVIFEDPHSFARPNEVVVKHIELDLNVDFATRRLSGSTKLHVENKTNAAELYLDSQGLSIFRVLLDDVEETDFELGESNDFLGSPLKIRIKPDTRIVTVVYETSPDAAALQWLSPQQTAGGKHPFLFTQSQAILARTWIPCQDSPGIRITYEARISTDPGLMAVMSAENPTEIAEDGVYTFTMNQPIPSYLLALAVGDLRFKALGTRSGVYAEPSMVQKAARELEDTEKMMSAAENLYGPYRWERYDVIVLPPSFPFGGMENPRLTFATPTILAGDKSLVSLVAHELAHSWSGNLVTNANWDDFWLNEGFTTYFEHRIMEEVYGKQYADMPASLSYQDLESKLEELGTEHADTHLHLDLAGRDPDDGMTAIAYDKGHFFLRTLEQTIGRDKWDAFLSDYFDKFAFKSMTSEAFVSHLKRAFASGTDWANRMQLYAWIYGPGLPDNIAMVHSNEFAKVEAELKKWGDGKPAELLMTNGWTTHHWLHFLRNLDQGLTQQQMRDLDDAFGFTQTGNSEILNAWLAHVITNKYPAGYTSLERFLTSMGRRKFLKPLYTKMAETSDMEQMAKLIYAKARETYHPIAVTTIDAILNWGKLD